MTVAPAGTSVATTAPAPIRAPRPILMLRPVGAMTTAFAPIPTSSSITIPWGDPVGARTAIVTFCQMNTRLPITTLLCTTVPKPW